MCTFISIFTGRALLSVPSTAPMRSSRQTSRSPTKIANGNPDSPRNPLPDPRWNGNPAHMDFGQKEFHNFRCATGCEVQTQEAKITR